MQVALSAEVPSSLFLNEPIMSDNSLAVLRSLSDADCASAEDVVLETGMSAAVVSERLVELVELGIVETLDRLGCDDLYALDRERLCAGIRLCVDLLGVEIVLAELMSARNGK